MTTTVEPQASEIVAELEAHGLGAAAERILYLLGLDDDDPDEAPIDRRSLRALADLLMGEPRLSRPRIGVGPGGLIHAEWAAARDGLLAMEFLPDGVIRFSGAFGAPNAGALRPPISGALPAAAALAAVQPIVDLIAR